MSSLRLAIQLSLRQLQYHMTHEKEVLEALSALLFEDADEPSDETGDAGSDISSSSADSTSGFSDEDDEQDQESAPNTAPRVQCTAPPTARARGEGGGSMRAVGRKRTAQEISADAECLPGHTQVPLPHGGFRRRRTNRPKAWQYFCPHSLRSGRCWECQEARGAALQAAQEGRQD